MKKTWLQTYAELEHMTVPQAKLFLFAAAGFVAALAIGLLWPDFVPKLWMALRYLFIGLMFGALCQHRPSFQEPTENIRKCGDRSKNEAEGGATRILAHKVHHSGD